MTSRGKYYIAFCLLLVCLIVLSLLLYSEWKSGGRVQTSLETKYIPTAQYLFDNPLPTPVFVHSIVPIPSSDLQSNTAICIVIDPLALDKTIQDIGEWTRIYLNNQRLSISDYGIAFTGELNQQGSFKRISFCLNPKLEKGLHIMEIKVGTTINALIEPNQTEVYTWAYRVN